MLSYLSWFVHGYDSLPVQIDIDCGRYRVTTGWGFSREASAPWVDLPDGAANAIVETSA